MFDRREIPFAYARNWLRRTGVGPASPFLARNDSQLVCGANGEGEPTKHMSLFPIFVKMEGRRCLVAGAGPVAEGKIEGLLASGASIHVVAPQATQKIREWAQDGKLKWSARPFAREDLSGVFLVIAATGSQSVHDEIYAEANHREVLCNAVDEPERCDFYYPAVVRRGELQIAISTGGASPALAQRLRKELEEQFGPEWEKWVAQLGRTRDELMSIPMPPEQRKRLLHQYASLNPEHR